MIANKAIEQMTRDEMSALQLKRLQKQVNWALEKSAYYYKVFSAAGINKDTIQSLDDIRKIPFTTPDDLEQVSAFDLLTLPISAVLRISRQGGKRTFKKIYTSGDLAYQIEMLTRVLVAHGINKSTVVGLLGESSDSRLMDVQYALENIGATVLLLGTDKENIKELITDFRIDVLISDFLQVTKLIVLLQAVLGKASALSLSIVIGLTSWMSIAKVVRTEVRVLRSSEYVQASHCMGGSFFHILRVHLAPNFLPSILFMVIMNVRGAILAESTLSFLGLGLPLEVVSWGSMLSLSEKALLTGSWWIIVIPGVFLVATLLSLTEIGNAVRKRANRSRRIL